MDSPLCVPVGTASEDCICGATALYAIPGGGALPPCWIRARSSAASSAASSPALTSPSRISTRSPAGRPRLPARDLACATQRSAQRIEATPAIHRKVASLVHRGSQGASGMTPQRQHAASRSLAAYRVPTSSSRTARRRPAKLLLRQLRSPERAQPGEFPGKGARISSRDDGGSSSFCRRWVPSSSATRSSCVLQCTCGRAAPRGQRKAVYPPQVSLQRWKAPAGTSARTRPTKLNGVPST